MATDYGEGHRPQSSATSLTIREHAAIQIMAGLASAAYAGEMRSIASPWIVAADAVKAADALMNVLYPPKPPNGAR